MTNGPTLPPQAYTREMLSVAFQWLQHQPESIKRLAQTPDALVGLYMRAQRFGSSAPETDAPVSSQNFISDLKNLAEGLKQFEEPKATQYQEPKATQHPEPKAGISPQPEPKATQVPDPKPAPQAAGASAYSYRTQVQHAHAHVPQPQAPVSQAPMIATTPAGLQAATIGAVASAVPLLLSQHLNASAQAMIQDVKCHLNLTSDTEVLNMLVALAYKNLKPLLT